MSNYLEKLSNFDLPDELHLASETLFVHFVDSNKSENVEKFFNWITTELLSKNSGQKQTSSGSRAVAVRSSGEEHTAKVPTAKVHTAKVHTVKVHTVTTGETVGADLALMKEVKNHPELQVEETDRLGCNIIIVLCPINSRPGSDVEAAMMKVSDDKPVILVTMFHTRDVHYSICGTAWSQTYPVVKLDVPVLFHETAGGLLACPRNDEAVRQTQEMLLNYSSRIHSSSNKGNSHSCRII
ncbi:hypothetical protein Q5P01_010567 [Channa striata]|uniref:Uncharacterized protein n=1 Tax=Channa striata TaxID=64152 RepID=A0AA88SQP5_CHASR|nr:hypothetical protein Q5P01_010567 [Channa striata]